MTRSQAAITFSATVAKREAFSSKRFGRYLQSYLAARDIAYPEQRDEAVNVRQCFAIARTSRKKRA